LAGHFNPIGYVDAVEEMDLVASTTHEEGLQGLVRFYLVDHETVLGKVIDISLLGLNLLFVAIFVAQTYPLAATARTSLWHVEVTIAAVFLCEYALRVYGASERTAELFNVYSVVDLVAVLPTIAVFFLPLSTVALNVGFLRVLRVVRVLRFYRFTKDAEFFFRDGFGQHAQSGETPADGAGHLFRLRGGVLQRRAGG